MGGKGGMPAKQVRVRALQLTLDMATSRAHLAVQMPSPQQLGVNPQQLNQSLQALPSGGLPQYGGPRPFGPGQFNPFDRPMPGPRPALDMMPSGAPKNFAPPSPRKPAPMSGLLSNLYGNFGG